MEDIGSKEICQIAIVVKDIAATAQAYADTFGMEVPPIRETLAREETNILYKGQPTEGRAKLAFFKMGEVTLELIEPIGGPSTWQEHLDEHGEGVHHLAFRVKGMDDVLTFLDKKGCPEVQRGDFKGGRYSYVDGSGPLKVVVELLERVQAK